MTDRDAQRHGFQSQQQPDSRALVVVPGSGGTDRPAPDPLTPRSFKVVRHDTPFVTQLIATAAQVPQTRGLRRASLEHAQSSYRAAVGKAEENPASASRTTSRVA